MTWIQTHDGHSSRQAICPSYRGLIAKEGGKTYPVSPGECRSPWEVARWDRSKGQKWWTPCCTPYSAPWSASVHGTGPQSSTGCAAGGSPIAESTHTITHSYIHIDINLLRFQWMLIAHYCSDTQYLVKRIIIDNSVTTNWLVRVTITIT